MTAIDLLQSEKQELLKRLNEINKALDSLMGESINIKWTERALACINDRQKISLSPDILKCLFFREPEILDDLRVKNNYMAALSMALRNMVAHGVLVKVSRPGVKGYFYGLPEWFENGKVKEEFDILMAWDLDKRLMQN